jgi:hypothetical protein
MTDVPLNISIVVSASCDAALELIDVAKAG